MAKHNKPVKRIILSLLLAAIFVFMASPLYMNAVSFGSIHKTNKNKSALVSVCGQKDAFTPNLPEENIKTFHHQTKDKTCIILDLPASRKEQIFNFTIIPHTSDKLSIALTAPNKSFHEIHYEVWVDFLNMRINNNEVLSDIKHVSNQKPYQDTIKTETLKPLNIAISAKQHHFTLKDLSADYGMSYLIFFTVIVLSFLLAYKLVNYLASFKLLKHNSRIDIVFISLFFLFLFIPMSDISKAETSANENRVLRKFPTFLATAGVNLKFGKQFESWFNDRFFGRRFMMSAEEKLKGLIEPHRGNKKVHVGKEGWLFYKGGDSLNNFANKSRLSDNQLEQGLTYLKAIDVWAKAHNKKFYYILIPDKHRIYGEYVQYIQKIRPDSESIDNQWINHIKKHSDVNAVYLYDTLMQNKGKELLYWKEDTHWNYYGAYIGYKEIIKTLAKDYDIKPYEVDAWQNEINPSIDLSRIYPYGYKDRETKYKEPKPQNKHYTCTEAEEDGAGVVLCKNPHKKLKVFILRDSFSGGLTPYFAETFGTVKLVWRYDITSDNLAEIAADYDIVILENVARAIPKILDKTFPKD